MNNYTGTQFHTSQVIATTESSRVIRKASTCIFIGAMGLYVSTLIPSHWMQKIASMSLASGFVYLSLRLDKHEALLNPYEAIAHQQSTTAYQAWLSHAMKPPAREVAIAEAQKAPPAHPVLKALFRLKLECDLVQELQSPSFVRTMVKPVNCKASQVLSTGQELQLDLGLNVPPVVSIFKGAIAIDTPRSDRQVAKFADYWKKSGKFEAAIGVDINNKLVSVDLSEPESCHVLGAGMSGSGKSVFLQAFLLSLLLERSPGECQLLICDAKRVTFNRHFSNCPHLIKPIISDPSDAIIYLQMMVDEMEARYITFEKMGVENIDQYNARASKLLARIIFMFDEYGDLLDASTKAQKDEIENLIIRLGQKARAAGINVIVFTQRPKKAVTPRLRANCPVRVLLAVADADDSESVTGNKLVDGSQLLGRGDLFFKGDRLQSLLPDESDFCKLLTDADTLTLADNSIADTIKPDLDDLSARQHVVSTSARQQLSAQMSAIVEYAKKQDEFVSARQIQSNVRIFRDASVKDIRSYFQWLAENNYGVVRGSEENLEFSVS